MRLTNDFGIPIEGCATFMYRGLAVHCNSITGEKEVQVWSITDMGSFVDCLQEFETVEQAINWIVGVME